MAKNLGNNFNQQSKSLKYYNEILHTCIALALRPIEIGPLAKSHCAICVSLVVMLTELATVTFTCARGLKVQSMREYYAYFGKNSFNYFSLYLNIEHFEMSTRYYTAL